MMAKRSRGTHLTTAWLATVLVLLRLSVTVCGQSSCTGTVDGKRYDLTPLSSTEQKVAWGLYEADFTPCKPAVCSNYKDVALCERFVHIVSPSAPVWPLGSMNSAEWRPGRSENPDGFQLFFRWDQSVETTIEFICDPNAGLGAMAPGPQGAETSFNRFFFEWKSRIACPVKESGNHGRAGGISVGWILITVLGSVVVSYVVLGALYNRFLRKQDRFQTIVPHYDFWIALPGLVKDGIVFSYRNVMRLVRRQTDHEMI
jgi:hypothetical protein